MDIGKHAEKAAASRKALAVPRAQGFGRILDQRHLMPSAGGDDRIQIFAQAALRLEADLVYALLTSNPAMGDGVALFHADHGNLITGATTAFDAANALAALSAARAKMRLQKDPAGHGYLDVNPRS